MAAVRGICVSERKGTPKHGVPEAELIADSPVFSINISGAAIPHHTNGMQNCRAIQALLAITGNFDREGGNLPVEYPVDSLNLKVEWDKFVDEKIRSTHIVIDKMFADCEFSQPGWASKIAQ